jgi:C4-dicarboxylate transporter/malic acid transport protein
MQVTNKPNRVDDLVRDFNPAWFAAIMGTAVIPLAVSFSSSPLVRPVSAFFIILAIVMFVAALVPWVARFIRHPAAIGRDLDHPIAVNFFPTMPIALIILALDFLKYPDLLLSAQASHNLAWYLWLLGSVGIYLGGFAVLGRIYQNPKITLPHANFGWYIPPVSKLLIPVAGFELAQHFPSRFELAFTVSVVSLGVGTLLFLFVGATVYQRYLLEPLPESRFAATAFIGIAPTAIIAVALSKLQNLLESGTPLMIDAAAVGALSTITILAAWGFSVWAFSMASILTIRHITAKDLPYALSWWAFTFPSGALAVASGIAWKVSGFESILWFYRATVLFMLIVWLLVTVRTVRAMISGSVFVASH